MSNYTIAIIVILFLCIIMYEAFHGYFFNVQKRGCVTCESFYVNPMFSDADKASLLMNNIDQKIQRLITHLTTKYPNDERTYLLRKNYEKNNIYEISPNNITGQTSFLRNKSILVLCLRRKDNGQLHDENTMMYVILHELAHMVNTEWGHEQDFWDKFHFLLQESATIGVYIPEDYAKKPVKYCGLDIKYSPLFETKKY